MTNQYESGPGSQPSPPPLHAGGKGPNFINTRAPTSTLRQAMACHQRGALAEAEQLYREGLAQAPGNPNCLSGLARLLGEQGRGDECVALFEDALRTSPQLAFLHFNLGMARMIRRNCAAAESAFRRAVELSPDTIAAYHAWGNALQELGRIDEAANAYRQVLHRDPLDARALNNLANILRESGAIEDALACLRRAIDVDECLPIIHSNYLFTAQFHPDVDPSGLHAELLRWREKFANPLRAEIRTHANDRSPGRRLRIGYLSPDFRDHVVGRNMIPLFKHMDRSQFDVCCYADVAAPDPLTEEFRRHSSVFRMVGGLTDQALVDQIRADGIDILVDLALHMPLNRLLVLARRPAPVQVTFAGYPGSTGLDTIDYRLTDPHLDPPEPGVDARYAERSLRLPATFWCYDPLDSAPAEPGPLPALANGYVTFGCLNHFGKVNRGVLKLWAGVLTEVPDSRLVLLASDGSHRERTLVLLEKLGVSRQRVRFEAPRPRAAYLKLYQQIDLGLDTVPYNGHTTSLDSLFMGVPVVTLVGRTVVGRAGLSQLMNLGLPELIAQTEAAFVSIAKGLARDYPRLAELRAGLRPRMKQSPLMDGAKFAQGIHAAYRTIWEAWRTSGGPVG